jgi:hypothetical protein
MSSAVITSRLAGAPGGSLNQVAVILASMYSLIAKRFSSENLEKTSSETSGVYVIHFM